MIVWHCKIVSYLVLIIDATVDLLQYTIHMQTGLNVKFEPTFRYNTLQLVTKQNLAACQRRGRQVMSSYTITVFSSHFHQFCSNSSKQIWSNSVPTTILHSSAIKTTKNQDPFNIFIRHFSAHNSELSKEGGRGIEPCLQQRSVIIVQTVIFIAELQPRLFGQFVLSYSFLPIYLIQFFRKSMEWLRQDFSQIIYTLVKPEKLVYPFTYALMQHL